MRSKKDGDSYSYGKMTHKLKKLFNDKSVPKKFRPQIPVICDEDGIQGVFAYLSEGDPVYDHIDGAWLNEKPHAAVHRVASAGKKKGVLPTCMQYCLSRSDNIKIDTHENNKIMQHQLEKFGFVRCGVITLENGESRIAYQYEKK